MKIKRLLAITLAIIMAFSCFSVMTFTAAAAEAEPQEIATKKAVYIGKTGSTDKRIANIFFSLTAQNGGDGYPDFGSDESKSDDGYFYFKLTFKAKMLSGSNPIVSFYRRATNTSGCGTQSEPGFVTSGKSAASSKFTHASYSYNAETNEYTYVFAIDSGSYFNYGSPWGYLCIGNVEKNDSWISEKDYDNSFIMTDPVLNAVMYADGEEFVYGDNLVKDFSDANMNMDSAFVHIKNNDSPYADSMINSPANKWSVMNTPNLVKHIEVPADFFEGANATFTKHEETNTTREYYTSDSYAGMYFEKLGETYKIINDIDKKMVVITANKEGDNRTATIGIPLQLTQYFLNAENSAKKRPTGARAYVKITADIDRLSGNGQPMVTRLYPGKGSYDLNNGTDANAYNITTSTDVPQSTYDASTGKFVGWVRIWHNSTNQIAPNCTNEVILLGNSEVLDNATDQAYESSFAIKNIQVDLYNDSSNKPGSLVASDICPDLFEETINDSYSYVNHDGGSYNNRAISRASTTKWSVCGDAYMVNAYSISDCYVAGHKTTFVPETSNTVNHYACATCGKTYKDAYGAEEIEISAKQQMIMVKASGGYTSNAVMPLDFLDTKGTNYYLFKCKMKLIGGDELPAISVMRATYHGITGAYSENGQSLNGAPQYSGYMAVLNYKVKDRWKYLQVERNLDAGTYQFDVDYKTEGDVKFGVSFNSSQTVNSTVDENGHMTITFTSAGGNFNMFLKDTLWTGTGKIYLANPVLKKVENGAVTGDNLVYDFSKQYSEVGSTISETYQWGGKWYKSSADSNVEFKVEKDSGNKFDYLVKAGGELWASYDKDTMTYTAVIKMDITSGNKGAAYRYRSPETLAHHAILLGNSKHVGNGTTDVNKYTSFAFTEPELYRLSDVSDITSTVGEDLCVNITDKSVNFGGTPYIFNNIDKDNHCTASNNVMAAPVDKWSIDGYSRYITAYDAPENFFGEDTDAKMLRISGVHPNMYQNVIAQELILEPGATYQFDMDYKNFAATPLCATTMVATNTSGFKAVDRNYTSANVDGSHMSFRFTMPSDARLANTSNGNFRIQLGRNWEASYVGSVYFANVSVRKVTNGTLGDNLMYDGDFSSAANNAVIKTTNIDKNLIGWSDGGSTLDGYSLVKTMNIPEGFFEGDVEEVKDIALKFQGGDWHTLDFKTDLKPNKTYRFTYNYRGFGELPKLSIPEKSGVTLKNISSVSNGEYLQTYEIVTDENFTLSSNQKTPNTRFRFSFGTQSYDKVFYISNVKLYEVVDGETVGTNILGELNPIYADDVYEGIEDGIALSLNQDDYTAVSRDIAYGWLGIFGSDKDVAQYATLVKVADDFYTFIPYAERLTNVTKRLLNIPVEFDMSKHDAKTDDVINVLDLVALKYYSAGIVQDGAANQAEALKDKIMNAPNTATQGTVYYVSNDGSDTLNFTGNESKPFASLSRAIQYAKSGDTILLNRGDVWRVSASSDEGFTIPEGVTLGAYGEGEKPLILGSNKDYKNASWSNNGLPTNVWKTRIVSGHHDGNIPGNIYFFNNANDAEPALIGTLIKNDARFASYNELSKEGEFFTYINSSTYDGYIYVYSEGNPADKYGRIEIGEKHDVVVLKNNVTVDNIAIKFAGGHAINATRVSNVTVTNCEIGYVGGAPNNDGMYGNGIQFGLGGSNITVANNYVYECCDAGITFQSWGDGTDTTVFDNIYFTENLLTNNFYNIEFFTTGTNDYKVGSSNVGNGTMKNIYITDNIMRFAGECWSYTQRLDGTYRCANICVTNNAYYINTDNLNIKDNVFDCTMSSHVNWTWKEVKVEDIDRENHVGLNVEGNTFYQKPGATDARTMRFGDTESFDFASSRYGLAQAVAKFDKNPRAVAWLENIVF